MEIFSVQPGHSIGWVAKVLGNDDNGRPLSSAEMAANARLIAAAPELLAACIALLAGWREHLDADDEWEGYETDGLLAAKAALAIAEGRE
jgi:hypothetical protein